MLCSSGYEENPLGSYDMKTFIVRFTVEDNELAQLRKRGMKDSAIRIALLDAGHY